MFTRVELLEAINKMIDNNAKNVNVWYSRYKSEHCFKTTEEALKALFDDRIFRFE